ncbi:MAG: glycosyltransferase [Candidatus Nanohaloarchaea archaeon]
MRIGFFTDSYFPEVDGVTYTLKTWRDRLEERGHEVHIVYPGSPEYSGTEREIPVKSVPNPFYEGYRIPAPSCVDIEFDIVHCHSPATLGVAGRFQAWKRGVPAVYTHHTPLEEYFVQVVKSEGIARLLGRPYVWLENRFLETFDRVTASTDDLNRSPDHVKLPVGVDTRFFKPQESSILEDMDLEGPVAGYSGRLSTEKNVDQVMAFAERFDGDVVVVGEGPQEIRIKAMAPENVTFRDWLERDELPGFYSSLDVFVTASEGDTLGLSPLEANACGTPVVAADNFPFDETIGLENGFRFEPGDIGDMLDKVQQALSSELEPRSEVKKYSMEKTIDRLEQLYGELDGG